MSTTTGRPKKLQRISQACDLCHRRSIRCRPSVEAPLNKCQNCEDFEQPCTYNRPSRRRRKASTAQTSPPNAPPGEQPNNISSSSKVSPTGSEGSPPVENKDKANADMASAASQQPHNQPDYTGTMNKVRDGQDKDPLSTAWRSFALASTFAIEQYMTIFMDTVYPLFPLFHGPTMWRRLRARHHLDEPNHDPAFFASIMAACALAAERARDGAVDSRYEVDFDRPENASEHFFAAAADAVPKNLTNAWDLGYMRACVLLAVTAIQYGQVKTMHQYMGIYYTLCSMHGFHNEEAWPKNITVIEREERRRLFWTMYNLDIYSSVVFDSVTRSQETHTNVRYPSEVNDEDLTAAMAPWSDDSNWLHGWNFTTDLYRVLEHSVKRIRREKHIANDRISITRLLISDGVPEEQVMENVLGLYYKLPAKFKDYTIALTGNPAHDIYGFQAANIQATLQLVRMTLLSRNLPPDVTAKCDIAQQVLSAFSHINTNYLRAISTPLIHHLRGIGQILAAAMEGLLCEATFDRVRGLLCSMVELLELLETGLQPNARSSVKLRGQINKIDSWMASQRNLISSNPLHILPGHGTVHGASGELGYGVEGGAGQDEYSSQPVMQLPIGSMSMQAQAQPHQPHQPHQHQPQGEGEFTIPPHIVAGTAVWPWPAQFATTDQITYPNMGFTYVMD